jgi:hypothetical protein
MVAAVPYASCQVFQRGSVKEGMDIVYHQVAVNESIKLPPLDSMNAWH